MFRVIDDVVYTVQKSDTRLRAVFRQLGDHREVSVNAPLEMRELDAPETVLQWHREKAAQPKSKAQLREIEEANRERTRRRRSAGIRRAVKVQGGDTLLTLTYKALVTDLSVCWRDWKEFVRRVRKVIPAFSYTVIWEPQKRGAWHAHASIQRISPLLVDKGALRQSFGLLRSIWRSVTRDRGGNVDVAKGKRNRSRAAVARYMSKYMAKSAGLSTGGTNLWSRSACVVPDPVVMEFTRAELATVAGFAAEWACDERYALCSGWIAPWGDTMFFAGERPR